MPHFAVLFGQNIAHAQFIISLKDINFKSLMRAFHVAIYLTKKLSELYKYVAVGEGTCCRRIEEIGAMLSGDII